MGQWPVCFTFLIIASLGREMSSVYSPIAPNDEANVGTVLFDRSSWREHCWTKEELLVLRSRMAFQDLLPEVDRSRMQDDRYVAELLGFLAGCLERVAASGPSRRLLLRALADAFGGYLSARVAPVVKLGFYAGNVQQRSIRRIIELVQLLRDYLRTNGAGWARPPALETYVNLTAIDPPNADARACEKLVLKYGARCGRRKDRRRSRRSRLTARRCVAEGSNKHQPSLIFLPYFDDDLNPNSIALPFKDRNLWSLYDEESVSILSTYYITCVQCITSKKNHKKILADFNRDFYKWLQQSVYPRLSDDKWYPAFGGVLRIIAFLKDEEMDIIEPTVNKLPLTTLKANEGGRDESDSFGTLQLILIAVSTAAVVWLLVGITLVCYKYRNRDSGECSACESPNSKTTPYGNVNYCNINTCPHIHKKSMGQKVKQWWKRKFTSCPDRSEKMSETEQCIAPDNYRSTEFVRTHVSRRVYKKRKKTHRSVSISASPTSSQYAYYENKKFHYSSDMTSSNSEDSSYR